LVVAFLEVGLVAVGGEQLGVGEVLVVADQGEAAVGDGVVGDFLLVDAEGEREDRLVRFAVAGVVRAGRVSPGGSSPGWPERSRR